MPTSLFVCTPAELRLNLNYRCGDCLLLLPPSIIGVHLPVLIAVLPCRERTTAGRRVSQDT